MVLTEAVRWRIVEAYFNFPEWTDREIADAVVSRMEKAPVPRTIKNILRLFHETGAVQVRNTRGGQEGMSEAHLQTLKMVVDEEPWLFLDEHADRLFSLGQCNLEGKRYHISTICRAFKRLGYTRTKLRELNRRRSMALMLTFTQLAQQFRAEQLLILDETKRDDRHLKRKMGRSPRGTAPLSFTFDIDGTGHSVMAVAGVRGILGYDAVPGGYCHEVWLAAFKRVVGPMIQRYPAPNSVVMMDNAPIHAAVQEELERFIEVQCGGKLVWLPPYCPEFSPIEKMFAQVRKAFHCITIAEDGQA